MLSNDPQHWYRKEREGKHSARGLTLSNMACGLFFLCHIFAVKTWNHTIIQKRTILFFFELKLQPRYKNNRIPKLLKNFYFTPRFHKPPKEREKRVILAVPGSFFIVPTSNQPPARIQKHQHKPYETVFRYMWGSGVCVLLACHMRSQCSFFTRKNEKKSYANK